MSTILPLTLSAPRQQPWGSVPGAIHVSFDCKEGYLDVPPEVKDAHARMQAVVGALNEGADADLLRPWHGTVTYYGPSGRDAGITEEQWEVTRLEAECRAEKLLPAYVVNTSWVWKMASDYGIAVVLQPKVAP